MVSPSPAPIVTHTYTLTHTHTHTRTMHLTACQNAGLSQEVEWTPRPGASGVLSVQTGWRSSIGEGLREACLLPGPTGYTVWQAVMRSITAY